MLEGGFLSDKEPRKTASLSCIGKKQDVLGRKKKGSNPFLCHHCRKYSLGIDVNSLKFQSELCPCITIPFEALLNN